MIEKHISIRPATQEDADAIAFLLRALGSFRLIEAEPEAATAERTRRHLAMSLSGDQHLVLVAVEANGALAGYAAVHWLPYLILAGPEGFVSELFVREDCRGAGIGGRLLDRIEAEARSRGCARLMLVNIRDRESYTRQFYTKQGWAEREDVANFVLKL
ncbi:MAG TPA: GNAT family N-acetyltransferase [Candidatus Obscuribacterales bacterium]